MVLSSGAWGELIGYLEAHESDIALDINDFGNLRTVFNEIFDSWPLDEEPL